MSYKDRAHDEAVAAEVNVDRALMCPAAGCPNRWSVSGERGRGCSAHYWAHSRDWPRITSELLDAETRRALYEARPRPTPEPVPFEQRKATVAALHAIGDNRPTRAWASELQRQHREGRRLTPAQVDAYRGVLHLDA